MHQPETTTEQAQAIFRQLQKEARKKGGQAKVKTDLSHDLRYGGTGRGRGRQRSPKSARGGGGVPWEKLFRAAEQRLRMRKWEIARYTLSQLLNALDFSDPDDPHSGQILIGSLD